MSGYSTLYNFNILSYSLNTILTSYLVHFDMTLLTMYTTIHKVTIYV
jgi:hypothetical protein